MGTAVGMAMGVAMGVAMRTAVGMAMGVAMRTAMGMAAVRWVVTGQAMLPQKSRYPAARRRARSGSSGRPSTVLWSPATDSNRWIPGPSSW
jgi:hypothetical protein